jgi:hypothetical protein
MKFRAFFHKKRKRFRLKKPSNIDLENQNKGSNANNFVNTPSSLPSKQRTGDFPDTSFPGYPST